MDSFSSSTTASVCFARVASRTRLSAACSPVPAAKKPRRAYCTLRWDRAFASASPRALPRQSRRYRASYRPPSTAPSLSRPARRALRPFAARVTCATRAERAEPRRKRRLDASPRPRGWPASAAADAARATENMKSLSCLRPHAVTGKRERARGGRVGDARREVRVAATRSLTRYNIRYTSTRRDPGER